MKLRSLLIASSIATALALPGAGTALACKTFYTTENVNVRAKASLHSESFGWIPKGTSLITCGHAIDDPHHFNDTTGLPTRWYKFSFGRFAGYISDANLTQ